MPWVGIPFDRVHLSSKPSHRSRDDFYRCPRPLNRSRSICRLLSAHQMVRSLTSRRITRGRKERLPEASGAGAGSAGKTSMIRLHGLALLSHLGGPSPGLSFSSGEQQGQDHMISTVYSRSQDYFPFLSFLILWWYLFIPGCEQHWRST